MWVLADVVGLFSIKVGPFSHNAGRDYRYSQLIWA